MSNSYILYNHLKHKNVRFPLRGNFVSSRNFSSKRNVSKSQINYGCVYVCELMCAYALVCTLMGVGAKSSIRGEMFVRGKSSLRGEMLVRAELSLKVFDTFYLNPSIASPSQSKLTVLVFCRILNLWLVLSK